MGLVGVGLVGVGLVGVGLVGVGVAGVGLAGVGLVEVGLVGRVAGARYGCVTFVAAPRWRVTFVSALLQRVTVATSSRDPRAGAGPARHAGGTVGTSPCLRPRGFVHLTATMAVK